MSTGASPGWRRNSLFSPIPPIRRSSRTSVKETKDTKFVSLTYVSDIKSAFNTGVSKVTKLAEQIKAKHAEGLEQIKAKHIEEIRNLKTKHAELVESLKVKYTQEIQALEMRLTSKVGEEVQAVKAEILARKGSSGGPMHEDYEEMAEQVKALQEQHRRLENTRRQHSAIINNLQSQNLVTQGDLQPAIAASLNVQSQHAARIAELEALLQTAQREAEALRGEVQMVKDTACTYKNVLRTPPRPAPGLEVGAQMEEVRQLVRDANKLVHEAAAAAAAPNVGSFTCTISTRGHVPIPHGTDVEQAGAFNALLMADLKLRKGHLIPPEAIAVQRRLSPYKGSQYWGVQFRTLYDMQNFSLYVKQFQQRIPSLCILRIASDEEQDEATRSIQSRVEVIKAALKLEGSWKLLRTGQLSAVLCAPNGRKYALHEGSSAYTPRTMSQRAGHHSAPKGPTGQGAGAKEHTGPADGDKLRTPTTSRTPIVDDDGFTLVSRRRASTVNKAAPKMAGA
jgi:hypothetical protein